MTIKKNFSYQPENGVHRITLYNTVYPEHQHRGKKERLYLHFDFACFYAQVEQLRNRMYGLPLIIGGWRKENGQVKGIVATSSYEARSFGIKTGMSAFEAYQLCPFVCMLQVDYASYTAISKQVHYIFKQFSHTVERYSMDEYFMDISFLVGKPELKIRAFAQDVQDKIFEATNLYGSIGIARSKTYAKLSSSLDKPKGITSIITTEDERAFIYPLDVDEVWGVGGRRYEHILAEGFRTIGDVVDRGADKTFMRLFGANFGKMLYQTITGQDQARVLEENDNYTPKWGVSYGHTFSEGSCDVERIKGEFAIAVEQVCYRLRAYGIKASSFSGMFGFNSTDQPGVGFKFGIDGYTNIDKVVFKSCMSRILPAIKGACRAKMEIRNIIIGTKEIDKTDQLNLFFSDEAKELERFKAIDQINNRYGKGTLTKAHTLLRVKGNTHFLERNG
ncbi:MAG: hypothetical protein JJ958_12140 [Balneola sp.]|nr:hypothetical protein [Balneola sp.]